jgi:hypothetical protein
MHELVLSSFQTKLLGSGFPERMRSTAFAFLGLTAAAGLTLVAIFAQLSFPLLSPAPMPSGPPERNAVAAAIALDHSPGGFARANPGLATSGGRSADTGSGGGSGSSGRSSEPVAVAPPAPTATPPAGGTSGGKAVEAPNSHTAPVTAPAPASEPVPTAVDDPDPAPKPAPPARPAVPTAPPAPGNSQSSSAASHASERGVEASSKSTPEPSTSGVTTSGGNLVPEASPGNGNGKALGQGK